MQLNASKLASKIVTAHMQNIILRKSDLIVDEGFNFGLYNSNGIAVVNNINAKVIDNQKFSYNGNNLILVDKSVGGHLGIAYIAIEENILFDTLNELENKVLISFVLLYLFLAVFGFYLTQQFIKPLVQQRIKLNHFIKDTTHELNTPISALIMSVNSSEPITPKAQDRILISAKRISEIYSDLTYLFLNSEQPIKQPIEPLDLEKELIEQLEYFKLFAQKKHIELSLESTAYSFKIDKESFIRVVNNLISNAIKYTPIKGKVDIVLKEGELIVKDTGNGISKKDLENIFQRFYRADDIQGGFGIGLNIVSKVCAMYGIKIEVDSKVNEGSEFKLIFK